MFSINVKTTETKPNYSHDLKTVVKALTAKKVVVGFPKGKLNQPHYELKWAKRDIKNKPPYPSIIDVAIKNNFGIGVPRREFMAEAAKNWQKHWTEELEKVQEGMEKGHMDVDKFLMAMGLNGENCVSSAIENCYTPPNSEYTKYMKMSDHPLIDSGEMKNSPKYEIRKAEQE